MFCVIGGNCHFIYFGFLHLWQACMLLSTVLYLDHTYGFCLTSLWFLFFTLAVLISVALLAASLLPLRHLSLSCLIHSVSQRWVFLSICIFFRQDCLLNQLLMYHRLVNCEVDSPYWQFSATAYRAITESTVTLTS